MENRIKPLIVNIGSSIIVKGLSIFVSYMAMPAYIIYFNQSPLLGVWLTLVGMLTWIINFDLGIGNGLRNKIVYYLAKKEYKIVKEYISSAYGMLSFLSLVLIIIGGGIIALCRWEEVFNISEQWISSYNLKLVILITFSGVIVYFVLKIVSSILLAMEKVALVNLLQLITNFANLCYIMFMKEEDLEIAIIKLAYFYVISLNIPYVVASILLFTSTLKKCRPNLKMVNNNAAKEIVGLGGKFFLIQIMLMLLNSTNEFLISNLYSPKYVVEYQIYYKVFYLVVTLFSLVTNPIWSNVSVAFNDQDYNWIKRIRKKINYMALISVCGIIALVGLFPIISKIWLGDSNINYDYKIGIFFAIYCGLMIFVLAETAIANGMNLLRIQLVFFSVGVILKFLFILLFNKMGIGWEGVVISNAIVLIPLIVAQAIDLSNHLKQC